MRARKVDAVSRIGEIGFCIVTDFPRPPREVTLALGELRTPLVSDVMGRFRVMDFALKPIIPNRLIVGPAFTIKMPPHDNLMLHKAFQYVQPGDIIVIDVQGDTTCAILGDNISFKCQKLGVAGVVIDGAIRDVAEIRDLGFQIFTRGVIPNGPGKNGPGEINTPISCGGVIVRPGDLILGDDDGVVVVPQEIALEVSKKAKAKEAQEAEGRRQTAGGNLSAAWVDEVLKARGLL
jgi:RraA family protein